MLAEHKVIQGFYDFPFRAESLYWVTVSLMDAINGCDLNVSFALALSTELILTFKSMPFHIANQQF